MMLMELRGYCFTRNMVPVPFIILYLKRFASFLAARSPTASRFLDLVFKNSKDKAGPVEEFQMLFVAVPFPGTGAWSGAIIASILDMPFWSGVSANFVGVVFAGLLINLLVNLGLKYAIITDCRYFGREQGPGKKSQVNKSETMLLCLLVATKESAGRDLDSSGSLSVFTGRNQNMDLVATNAKSLKLRILN